MSMDSVAIRKLLNTPALELSREDFDIQQNFRREMHSKLLELVPGKNIRERNEYIENLTFDERLDLILGK